MNGRGTKLSNEYQRVLGGAYEGIPKAVLAAVAVSFAIRNGADVDAPLAEIIREWGVLAENGIIPQAVPSKFRMLVPSGEDAPPP